MNVADYLARQYPSPPCWALVVDVLRRELGLAVPDHQAGAGGPRAIAAAFRLQLHRGDHGFERADMARDFTVVLMGKSPALGLHHCGICHAGRVLHALDAGVVYQDLASLRDIYPLIEFWNPPC